MKNTSFDEQEEATVYQYTYRITDEGPEDLKHNFEEQRYTGWLYRITGEAPVCFLLSEQGIGIPVKPTGLPVDCQVPLFNRPFTSQKFIFPHKSLVSLPNGKPLVSPLIFDSQSIPHSLNQQR